MKKIIKSIITLLFLALSIFLIFKVNKLGLIPNKYLIIGSIALIVLNAVASTLLFCKSLIPKIFSVILYIIIAIVSIIGIHLSTTVDTFLDNNLDNPTNTVVLKYYVLSKKEMEPNDLNDSNVYYFDNKIYSDKAIKALKEKYNVLLFTTSSVQELFNYDLILIDSASLNLIKEETTLDISEYKSVYEFTIEYDQEEIDKIIEENNSLNPKEEQEEQEEKEEIVKKKEITNNNDHYFNIYIGAYDFTNRTDLNKIVTVNTKTNEILITNIHRFTYLDVPGYGIKNRLSDIALYGIQNNINALEYKLNIKIDYYLIAKPDGLVTLIDDIGGIDYCSDMAYTTDHAKVIGTYDDTLGDHVEVKKGCQHFNGIETLTVARERLAFQGGAWKRDENTTAIMLDIFEQMKKPSNITRYSTILNDLSGMYNTTVSRSVLTKSIKQLLDNGWSIKVQTLRGKNTTGKIGYFDRIDAAIVNVYDDSLEECLENIKALDK